MPPVQCPADLSKAADAILQAVAHGEMSPAESEQLTGVLEFLRRNLETVEPDRRQQVLTEARAFRDPE